MRFYNLLLVEVLVVSCCPIRKHAIFFVFSQMRKIGVLKLKIFPSVFQALEYFGK